MDRSLILGRQALLEALRALAAHVEALVLVGAHAVQEWAAPIDAELGGSPASKDADLQVDPDLLISDGTLADAMASAGFVLSLEAGRTGAQPGIWIHVATGIQVDLLVAATQARGKGRAAMLDARDPFSARSVDGLEPCTVLHEVRTIAALDNSDGEVRQVRVARPAALVVSKAFKLAERVSAGRGRVRAKDALDVLRLLLAEPPERMEADFRTALESPLCDAVARQGLAHMEMLFATNRSPGGSLLRAEYGDRGEVFAAQAIALSEDLLTRLEAT